MRIALALACGVPGREALGTAGPCVREDDEGRMREGTYSNLFHVGFNAYEVVIDFGQSYPGNEELWLTRIVTSPAYARNLLGVLQKSMNQYEERFGEKRKKIDE
jgi:hypothetical protein